MPMCICLHLPVLILLVDSDWLISMKVGQSLTRNRNYFYLRQNWSNFDQVRQSDVDTIKVSKSKSVKVTWSNFDQVNFDSVNRLLCSLQVNIYGEIPAANTTALYPPEINISNINNYPTSGPTSSPLMQISLLQSIIWSLIYIVEMVNLSQYWCCLKTYCSKAILWYRAITKYLFCLPQPFAIVSLIIKWQVHRSLPL